MGSNSERWKQRLQNFERALDQLRAATELRETRPLTPLEKQGLVQAFEFTHELAWNTLKDYFEYQGNSSITGSRDATREAFQFGLILDGQVWIDMIQSRNLTSHTYNEQVVDQIVEKIASRYAPAILELQLRLHQLSIGSSQKS